ncbi:hypothetical protein ORIO_07055 [Cereibacter azotoformans]|uniref:Uncharacterized protein n=1 Tax=Cereibacter sphaeroides (strain ATCC 17025 / ATH 2.4.3) TaxID=349102 RepID=A4WSK8_CERS5|nr:hypothetical protein [Cereibacter azotoformans]ULB09673.1 hypothetical protein ORIO_07055 [Cereibacter azotoformans]
MLTARKPALVQPVPETPAADPADTTTEGLAHLLAEMQGLALVLPPVDRTDAEIEAGFDNMPV